MLQNEAMATKLDGALYTDETHILYVGPLIASRCHRHHAGQVMWIPGGLLVEDESGSMRQLTTHVVPPDTPHGHGAAPAAAVLWVDRDDLDWERASSSSAVSERLAAAMPERLSRALTADEARDVARALLAVVAAPSERARPRHPAVTRLCALLESAASEREVRLAPLARQAGLSPRQLRHRFTEEVGLAPRAYLRWRRLRRSVAAIERGATLTEAAVAGGFADGAHFSRVFHAQFGMAPSQALSSVRFGGALR